ncbi:MAG TPA: hypothetical protein PLE19_15515 [Planctomycetota bacterium]|nr:hypothetical protein [Planctomycetota bacterium]HRR79952.1 hypothetical protein [Planctomycetota bacterium]HRT97282.1 hypothetical protein [Planctomycetota bacterium]
MPARHAVAAGTILLAISAHAQLSLNPRVREVADFALAQQTPQGCIPDAPGALRANEDGAMARSLLAAAYAYRTTGRVAYRNAWRDGIKWLALAMERDGQWAGTWHHAHAAQTPHVALPTALDGGAQDTRGCSSAAALFLYHVALYTDLATDDSLAVACRPHVYAALDFLLEKNRGPNDLFYLGWVQPKGQDTWELCRRQRARDQADVLLGLWAGSFLTGQARCRLAASRLEQHIPQHLFHKREQAFATAIDEAGSLIPPVDDAESQFTQAYLAWVLGASRETEAALKWLEARMAPDGSFRKRKDDRAFVLPVAAYCLGAGRVGNRFNDIRKARTWLRDFAVTPKGGIREFIAPDAPVRNDLAGWVILAWLTPDPRPFSRLPTKP